MIRGYQKIERMTQNMIDAGCSEAVISCFLSCLQQGDKAGSLCQLEEWRAELLREIHKEQSCIEFLDEQLCILKEQSK